VTITPNLAALSPLRHRPVAQRTGRAGMG